jgi:predicted pyridoxine 5'-phosphate oxidase superfamily flavin-nucleotide-binding protein
LLTRLRGRSWRGEADIKKSVAASFQDIIRSKYLLLTTFTKDGRPKPTPI